MRTMSPSRTTNEKTEHMKCKLRAPYGALSFFVKEVKKVPYIHFTKEQKLRASKTDLPDDHEEPVQQLR